MTLDQLREAHAAASELHRGTVGNNVTYFETGQGSALSADAHHDVDEQTLEARAYAVCRAFDPLLVNTVVGFIGPEYLFDGKQILRAGLEDHLCGKLLGVPMGVDVCYTNHAEADADDTDTLLLTLGAAGCSFVITVPGGDDIMLNYQSLSFQDVLQVRQTLGLRPAPEFEAWLGSVGLLDDAGRVPQLVPEPIRALMAMSDVDPWDALRAATRARVGLGRAGDGLSTAENLRLAAAHAQARDAVHTALDADAIVTALGDRAGPVVHSQAADRAEYLQRPDLGRRLAPDARARGRRARPRRRDLRRALGPRRAGPRRGRGRRPPRRGWRAGRWPRWSSPSRPGWRWATRSPSRSAGAWCSCSSVSARGCRRPTPSART